MIKSSVLEQMAAKRAELEARKAELEAEQARMEAELVAMQQSEVSTGEALATFEALLEQTPTELKPNLFRILFKTLEQEAKRLGINLAAEVTIDTTSNGNGGKRTRKSTESIDKPAAFAVFPQNKRLALDGFINDDTVSYSKVYIGVDGLRTTAACEGSASAWKNWFSQNIPTTSIKVGNFFEGASGAGLAGNYIMELTGVAVKDLAKLVDIDFAESPSSEVNEERMNRDYAPLSIAAMDADVKEPEPSNPQPEQIEEIREEEPIEVIPVTQPEPTSYYPVGTKFQLTGVSGFDGKYGEIVGVIPGTHQPYECQVDGFSHNPLLKGEQLSVIPEDETTVVEEDLADIPF
jgi:hypothetical protein